MLVTIKNGQVLEYSEEAEDDMMVRRSESLQEILSKKPGFLERWSLPTLSIFLIVVLASTWFIKYPDIIQANATLTAANAPKEIITRSEGKLVKLLIDKDQLVSQNDNIAWLESIGDHKQVISLNYLLDSSIELLKKGLTEDVSNIFAIPFQRLGELQTNYQQFISAWQQFDDYLVNGYYFKRKEVLEKDLQFLKRIHSVTEEQWNLTQEDVSIMQQAFDSNDTLFKYKVISKQDLRDQQSKLLAKKMSTSQLKSVLINNESQQADKIKDIRELEHNISMQKIIFIQALETMKSMTDDWIKKYVIKAPEDGKVVFIIPLQENQFLSINKVLGYVNPADSRFYAQVNLSQSNFGKINIGEKVQLRFDAYPYQEFGPVVGKLTYISKVPSDSGFLATVDLTNGLRTSSWKEIQFKSGLKAQALIITKDARLLQRIYYIFVKGFQR